MTLQMPGGQNSNSETWNSNVGANIKRVSNPEVAGEELGDSPLVKNCAEMDEA
jgi:hypothetical protein